MSTMGNKKNHFNVKIVKSGFKQLASKVQHAADLTAATALQDAGAFTMSFDEATNVLTNVPGSGRISVTTVEADAQQLEYATLVAADKALPKMTDTLTRLVKEAGL